MIPNRYLCPGRKSRRRRLLHVEQCEPRYCLSAIGFAAHDIIKSDTNGASDVLAADIDGDGDLDVLTASRGDGKVAWHENADGAGNFGPQKVITAEAEGANFVRVSDVDGDGDLDVLSASAFRRCMQGTCEAEGQVAWYENTDGKGEFGEQQIISHEDRGVQSLSQADVDGDGDLDVLWATEGEIAWSENTDGGSGFGPKRVITDEAVRARSVSVGDIDGDGDSDILYASWKKVAWHANTDGQGSFGAEQIISTEPFASSVTVGDLDRDGDLDVVANRLLGSINWYENTDGAGNFESQQVSTGWNPFSLDVSSVVVSDLDDDGDLDLLVAFCCSFSFDVNIGEIAWYENLDGAGGFAPKQLITDRAAGGNSVAVGDLDGDGDLDVLSASSVDDKIAWYENENTARAASPGSK